MSTSETSCNVCNKLYPIDESLTLGKCNHQSCKCLVNYIKANLHSRIKCPISSCSQSIYDDIIRKCLSNNEINAYEQLSIAENLNVRKCPVSECPFVYMFEDDLTIFNCEYCESPICIKCNNIHYPINDGSCSATQNQSLFDKAYEIIKRKKRDELQEMYSIYKLLPNPEKFECSFCTDVVLPRSGVILRNCLHCFCGTCLRQTYSNTNFVNQLKCQTCNTRLCDKELCALIEEKTYTSMLEKEATNLWFHCKKTDCPGVWHISNSITSYQCKICKTENCITCGNIHTNMTCEQFRKTQSFIVDFEEQQSLKAEKHVNCNCCNRMLIQDGGCGSLYCDNCGNHTCVFTGLFAGIHEPQKCGCWITGNCSKEDRYCKCTSKKTCHDDCEYGCFPE